MTSAAPDPQLGEVERAMRRIAAARQEALAADSGTSRDSSPASGTATGMGCAHASTLRVRCPHCQRQVAVAEETSWSHIVCAECGSTFSLIGEPFTLARKGDRLGRFVLVSPVGEGGFGAVWRARDTQLDREVALKFPRRGELNSVEAELFLREARASAQLRHPNIVSLHEVGRDGATLYLVYDLVEGQSLAERLQQRMSIPEAIELCETIARALDYAHRAGIVHRDLKPANILLDADAAPRLTDFGLAKRNAGEVTMTMDGQVVGTPAYMSPEQAGGRSHDSDARSDVYSLGVVLFEMLTGELPFRGSPRRIIEQVLNDDAPSPRALNARISRDLETICLKCLEKQPAGRYASAAELAADLARLRLRQPIVARPAGPARKLFRACRRHPVAANAILLFAVLAICGPLAAVHEARIVRKETQARRRGDRYLYVAQMNNVQDACEAGDFRRAVQLLGGQMPTPGDEDLRSFEWRYWWHVCHRGLVGQVATGQRLQALAVSPEGNTFAYGGADGRLIVCDRTTLRELRALRGHAQPIASASYVRDGRWLVTGAADRSVRLWNAATGVCVAAADGLPTGVRGVALSPDGTRVAAALDDASVRIWDLGSGSESPRLVPAPTPLLNGRSGDFASDDTIGYCVVWNKSGTHLALGVGGAANWSRGEMQWWNVATGQCEARLATERPCDYLACAPNADLIALRRRQNTVTLWNSVSHAEVQAIVSPAGEVFSPVFTREGESLLASSDRGAIFQWDCASGELIESWPGHAGYVYSIAALPRGEGFVSAGSDGNIRLWRQVPATNETPSTKHRQWIGKVEIDRDGAVVASCGFEGEAQLLRLIDGEHLQSVTGAADGAAMALSPDGRYVAYRAAQNTAAIWDVRAKKPAVTLEPQRDSIYCMAYSPDGKFLAVAGGNARSPWPGDATDLRLWRTDTGRVVYQLQGNRRLVRCMQFSPDGKTLATGGFDRVVLLWDVETGLQRGVLDPRLIHNVVCLAFSPEGKTLAFATHDGSLWLADPRRPTQPLKQFSSQDGYIWAIAYTPDGKTLAAAFAHENPGVAESGGIKLWDTATGEIKTRLITERRLPSALAFAGDGETLAVGFRDGSLHLYRGPQAGFIARAAR